MLKLYTTHCVKCKILQDLLDSKNVEYQEITDVELMLSLGMVSSPSLEIENGTILNFADAVQYVRKI